MVEVNVDAIPAELKERPQWLMWDNSSDTPRRPHWRGNFGVSWTNPDDWHTFEEAYEAAQERESWGIGYVFASGLEDYPRGLYGGLDIDGCADKDGSPKDWLPSLEPFIENGDYVEFSPSKDDPERETGIHIPVVGLDLPEWWSDCSVGEHEGVEAYEKKFFTFTGDTLKNSGETVAEHGEHVVEWLKEAYESITGETPWVADSSTGDDDRTVTQPSTSSKTGNAKEIAAAVDQLDARDVAEKTIVRRWNSESSASGDNRAFYPTWGGSNCNGTANIVDRDGWTDTGTDSGSGGPLEMAAIDMGEISHSGCSWGDVSGKLWWKAVDHLRELGFPIPEYERDDGTETDSDGSSTAETLSSTWAYVYDTYEEEGKADGRLVAADALEHETHWMYVMDSEKLWVYNSESGYFNPWGEQWANSLLESSLGKHYSQQEAREIIGRIEARNQTKRKHLNARTRDSKLLCVGNGVVDLETGDMKEHSPAYKFTRGLKWAYDPENADTEPVLEFLDDVTKRPEDRDTLLDHLAHGLMPGHPYRAFVMMYGPGSNGKTRVGKLFRGFVGEENAASVELQDLTGDDSFATGGLPGAFINVGDDISVGEIRDTSIIKSLTGDGTVRANEKYEKQYEFENEAAMFFSANEPPRIKEQTVAISDRLYPIEMPYRFVDDPKAPTEKKKVPGIASDLLEDDAAMRGLLVLAVEHARKVIDRNGEYSMPEGPEERRELYESASDPIQRFALAHLSPADGSGIVVKEDVYSVYTQMCDLEGERAASEDAFKRKISQMSSIDVESTRSRAITPGEDRDRCWRYVEFAESAKKFMNARLVSRYFEEDEDETEAASEPEPAAFGATPITKAAESLTGYVTVTAEIVTVDTFEGENPTTKAILKDETGVMDFVTWDDDVAELLKEREGGSVVVKHAEVGEHNGKRQLQSREGLTEIGEIQAGVGYTESKATAENQSDLGKAATDGGETAANETETEDTPEGTRANRERLSDVLERNGAELAKGELIAKATTTFDGLDPEAAEHALRSGVEETGEFEIVETDDGVRVRRL
ncbi:phage/plasmid primase, P4 family [Haloarchaeobius sp. TZWWS8]|uniref:phage/plasmid primase, P4 family n=1 Tax=Haloarchaeobius sp. TZWWS8 TaxID=3446121 RepID=UPI003EBF9FCC